MRDTWDARRARASMTTQRRSDIPFEKGDGYLSIPLQSVSLEDLVDGLSSLLEGEAPCDEVRLLFFELLGNGPAGVDCDKRLIDKTHRFALWFQELPYITVALVDGRCSGWWLEFMFLCDMAYATEGSVLCVGEGFVPLLGGIQLAARTLGLSKAKGLFLLGEAEVSEVSGAFNGLVPDRGELTKLKDKLSASILSLSQTAQVMTKRIVDATWDISLEAGLSIEREMFSFAFSTQDKKEGIKAFFEKRRPNFVRRKCHEL